MRVDKFLEVSQKALAAADSDMTVGNQFLGAWGSAIVAGYDLETEESELFIGAYLRDLCKEIECDHFGKIIKVF